MDIKCKPRARINGSVQGSTGWAGKDKQQPAQPQEWARKAKEAGTRSVSGANPTTKTTLILVQRKDKHASDHRRRQMQHTPLQSGKEEKESSGSHPETTFFIGFRRYEGYRYMGGRKRKWRERRKKEWSPHCDLKWTPRTILSINTSTSVMQHTYNPNFTDCHFFLKHLLGDFFPPVCLLVVFKALLLLLTCHSTYSKD